MKKARCWIGEGQGGKIIDALLTGSAGGIDRLAKRISYLGVQVERQRYYDSQEVYDEIQSTPPDVVVILGGTSLTANETTRNAKNVSPRKVDYIFGIQPSLSSSVKVPVPPNVLRAHCFVTPWWAPTSLMWWLGAYKWTLEPGNRVTRLTVDNTYAHHPGSNDETVQSAIVADIKEVIT